MATHALILSNASEPSSPIIFVNLSQCKTLTTTNYPQWAFQIQTFLEGLELFHFLDGTHQCPDKTLTVDSTSTPNPAYSTWTRQDRLLLASLVGTLDASIAPLVTHSKSSHEAWSILSSTFANPSRGHILQIKNRLESITKTPDQTITEYMHKIKTCTLELANLGKPMDPEDIIAKILRGLDSSHYRAIKEMVEARDTTISFDALHEKLINHDLTKPESTSVSPLPTTAFAAHYRSSQSRYPPRKPAPPLLSIPGPNLPTDAPICQYCGYKGHSFSTCRNFKKAHPSVNITPYTRSQRFHNNRPQAHTATASSSSPHSWLVDSGATHHITNDLSTLALHAPYAGPDDVVIGDGTSLPISNIGSFTILSNSSSLHFRNVLHVPLISRNILSVSQFCTDNNATIEFSPSNFVFKDISTDRIILHGTLDRGIYSWHPSSPQALLASSHSSTLLWHHRLGHSSSHVFSFLKNNFNLPISSSSFDYCNACKINKCHKLPFSESTMTSHAPLELLFSDVWSSPLPSHDGFKYYVIFVDHFTKYTWLYPLKNKSDTFNTFHQFKLLVERYFHRPIIQMFSDNGGEYIKITPSLLQNGISHLTSPPHTPEHNGYAERRHRHIVETGLSLLTHAQLPTTFWPAAFATAVYLINRLPTTTLQNASPYSRLFNVNPNYNKLRAFGCLCYPWLRPYSSNKLAPKSTACVFLGYSKSQSAYYCLDPTTNRTYTSRHVTFVETEFPYLRLASLPHAEPPPSLTDWCEPPVIFLPHTSPSMTPVPTPVSPPSTANPELATTHLTSDPDNAPTPPPNRITTRLSNNIRKPNPKYAQLAITTTPHSLPTSAKQALSSPQWRTAMLEEYHALTRNKTWSLVPAHEAHNVIGCKWVFRVKYNPDNTIQKYKARLVAKGFHQQHGIDYSDTFSPVVKPVTIRLLLSLALSHGWSLRQLDINNAFLQGTLHETVFMAQPPGFINEATPTHVCCLKKAIYGLKQAPRAWYTELKTYLLHFGFTASLSDPSLFIYKRNTRLLYALVYVDDIIVTGPSNSLLTDFITNLATRFSLKDLGSLSYFLGIEVTHNTKGLLLSQAKYVFDLLQRHDMLNCKPSTTPMLPHPHLTLDTGSPPCDATAYRCAVGSLQYLSLTRPDISYSVNKLAQFMQHPQNTHWAALKRLFRYLHGTMHLGLQLHRTNPLQLHAFSDADWAGDKDTYISTSGYIVYLGKNPIAWASKKQKTIARSSTEAEFRAVADATSELIWVRSILSELGLTFTTSPTIYCDNLSATHYSANPIFHSRMKHVALAFHFVREQVQAGALRVTHISGDDQLADALTKPLPHPRFETLLSKIGLFNGQSVLRGNVKETNQSTKERINESHHIS